LDELERSLHDRGQLAGGERLLSTRAESLELALSNGQVVGSHGAIPPLRRWQRLLQLALFSNGAARQGDAAAPGVVVGTARLVAPSATGAQLGRSDLALLEQPLSRFAPLLWRVSGIVCFSGNESAHLFEVARSRRLPAVIVHGLSAGERRALDGALLLVEGDAGELWLVPGARTSPAS
jgi:hypothetical protein